MPYFVSTPPVIGNPGEVDDSARNRLGATAVDADGNEYIYLKGVASTIAGSWVTYDAAFATANLATDSAPGDVAIATAAVVANKYGWYGRKGAFICGAISGGDAAAGARVFASATDFLPDDVEGDDMQVLGANFITQEGEVSAALGLGATAGLATARINNPWFGIAVDASA
jgi:hypothetical protein